MKRKEVEAVCYCNAYSNGVRSTLFPFIPIGSGWFQVGAGV